MGQSVDALGHRGKPNRRGLTRTALGGCGRTAAAMGPAPGPTRPIWGDIQYNKKEHEKGEYRYSEMSGS